MGNQTSDFENIKNYDISKDKDIKIVFVGDKHTEKTKLILKYLHLKKEESTIQEYVFNFQYKNENINVSLTDALEV